MFSKLRGKDSKTETKKEQKVLGEKLYLPLTKASSKCTIPEAIGLNGEEQEKYDKVLKYFQQEDFKVAVSEANQKDKDSSKYKELSESEKAWLTRECFLRYLRATKWHYEDTISRIELTLAWRREFGIAGCYDSENEVNGKLCSPENETGRKLSWDMITIPDRVYI